MFYDPVAARTYVTHIWSPYTYNCQNGVPIPEQHCVFYDVNKNFKSRFALSSVLFLVFS